MPLLRDLLVSPRGVAWAMRTGVARKGRLSDEVLAAYREPFLQRRDRRGLILSAQGLHPKGLEAIAEGLPDLGVPTRAIYGARDRILPDVARTMQRVARDLPGTEVTALEDAGHFLQEDAPERVASLIGRFLADVDAGRAAADASAA